MEIWINDYQLAKEGREGVSGFQHSPRRNVEFREGVGRATVAAVDRQNLRRVYTFSVARQHATPAAAELYALTHASVLPHTGTVKFVVGAQMRWLLGAAIEVGNSSYTGVSTRHTYTITGGALVEEDPNA